MINQRAGGVARGVGGKFCLIDQVVGFLPGHVCMKGTIKNKTWAAELHPSSHKNSLVLMF